MPRKYEYYIITGFIPAYVQLHRKFMTVVHPRIFGEGDPEEAAGFYKETGAKMPITRKILQFDINTSLYFLKYGIDDLIMMIRAIGYIDAVKAFNTLRSLLALYYHSYSEDLAIVPLKGRPSYSNLSAKGLVELADVNTPMQFSMALLTGVGVPDNQLYTIEDQLMKSYSDQRIRRALACFYQSQIVYYTHMVGSYVEYHSRPELIELSSEEYRHENFLYQEMLHASLITCYRGIEAIYSKNFRSNDFKPNKRKELESYMDTILPNTPSRSRYRLRFYRQREEQAPKHKLLVNMLEVLFRARNRAAHGYRWQRTHRFETFGSDLIEEAKFFLGHLIVGALAPRAGLEPST